MVFFLGVYVFAAFHKAQDLTKKRPVEYLLNERNRSPDYCPWDQISEELKKYFVLIEDPGFFKRSRTPLKSFIIRGYSYYFEKDQIIHGSTISQQLAKNLYLRFDRTLFRKITEYFICLKIERRLTKEEIFTFYLNIIYFGNNIYGISNASEYYFSKKPAELTANQAIFISCLIAAPNAADPVHYPDTFYNFKIRKLEKCFQEGLISEKELRYFCSFPEDCPDPEFAPDFSRTEKPPVVRMENECFGPFHSHETEQKASGETPEFRE
jgi:membrane peptidoglycan carboxypeptidase